jgi:hypothetical protein
MRVPVLDPSGGAERVHLGTSGQITAPVSCLDGGLHLEKLTPLSKKIGDDQPSILFAPVRRHRPPEQG